MSHDEYTLTDTSSKAAEELEDARKVYDCLLYTSDAADE